MAKRKKTARRKGKKRGMKKGTVCFSPAARKKLAHDTLDKAIKVLRQGKAKIK